jgi:N-acetylglucosamine kinase-like BadF-type ATPase
MTPRDSLLLGVDGGGTSTVALLGSREGHVVGRGVAGPSNAKAVGAAAARQALEASMAAAFADAGLGARPVAVACLGLAGFGRDEDQQVLAGWADQGRWAERLILVNDGDLVVAAGTPGGWGVGVIAGTGSIAVARAPDGRIARAGGWGHLIGDEGSAYALVLAALRRVARRADRREVPATEPDPLTVHLCRALGINGTGQLVPALYAPGFDRSKIASLAPAVLAAAAEDPSIGEELLRPAGSDLAEIASAAARTLGWDSGSLPLALAGGLLLSSPIIVRSLLDHLRARGYDPIPAPVPDPALGALLLARRALSESGIANSR